MHRNPKKNKHSKTLTTLVSSGTKLLLPSWLLGFQHEERDTQFLLCWLFPSDPTMFGTSRRSNCLASTRLKNQLASSRLKSPFLQRSPKILSPSLPNMTSFTSPISFSIRGFYYDICDCHILPARAWTPVLNVWPYPCTKPNSSKPN